MVLSACKVEVLRNKDVRLLAPLSFRVREVTITLHIGFTWNMADIPTILHSVIGCPSEFIIESALHDALYRSGIYSRELADLFFYLILRSGGEFKEPVGKLKAKELYAGVRIGGSSHYRAGSMVEAREFISVEFK